MSWDAMETEDFAPEVRVDQQENEDVSGADDLRRVQHFHGVYLQDSYVVSHGEEYRK